MPALTDDQVLARILPHVDQCPTQTVKLAIIDTLVNFYHMTKIDQRALAAVDTVVDQPTYTLTMPTGFQFVQAESVLLNKIPLEEKSADDLDLWWGEVSKGYSFTYRNDFAFGGLDEQTWRLAVATQPRFYHFESDGKIRLIGIPQTVYAGAELGLLVKATVKPIASQVVSIDDSVWNDHYEILIAGVLSRLLLMPKKPWSEYKLGQMHGSRYVSGYETVAAEIRTSNTRQDREIYHTKAYA